MPNDSTIDNDSRGPTTHDLKCRPEFYDAVVEGRKTFEVRKNDRGFQTGDVLVLRKWDPAKLLYVMDPEKWSFADKAPTHTKTADWAPTVRVRVTYVLSGMGIEPGYVCMATALIEEKQ